VDWAVKLCILIRRLDFGVNTKKGSFTATRFKEMAEIIVSGLSTPGISFVNGSIDDAVNLNDLMSRVHVFRVLGTLYICLIYRR
jgi:hypothetical protein